jgi:hypothetical protein
MADSNQIFPTSSPLTPAELDPTSTRSSSTPVFRLDPNRPRSANYGRNTDNRPIVIGVALIIFVIIIAALGTVWWQQANLPSPELDPAFASVNVTPTPTPAFSVPLISVPTRLALPAATKNFADYFNQDQYSIAFTIVSDPSDNPLTKIYTNYTVNRSGQQVLIEAPDFNTAVLLDFDTGYVYSIDHQTQTIYLERGLMNTVLNSYIIIDPKIFTQIVTEGQETWNNLTYKTQSYPGITAFFYNNELQYLRDDDLNIVHQVIRYTTDIDPSIFILPSSYIYEESTVQFFPSEPDPTPSPLPTPTPNIQYPLY